MSSSQTSPNISEKLTQHAMLVVWGLYARRIGLVEAIEQVKLKQKTRTHRPQTKVLEFLVAILAGLPHLKDISRSAHPLDQDQIVAEAWGQAAWADYSGVSRTLKQLSAEEVTELVAVLEEVSQPFIDREVERALALNGELVYDADLTGRPVSSTSTSYPNAEFGYMGDTIELGYQAALVSLHSPTFGRLWLANELHPGDTVSMTQAQALALAAERRTGRRPMRRLELLSKRLAQAKATLECRHERLDRSFEQHREAHSKVKDTALFLREWEQAVRRLTAEYQRQNRQPTAHCQLTRAKRKVATYTKRLPRCQKALAVAERRLARHERQFDEAQSLVDQLQRHYEQCQAENAANPSPIQATFRLDGGFASRENIAWLIEMGYEVYTRGRSIAVRDRLSAAVTSETNWVRVGGNATLTAWSATTVEDYFVYPMDVALAHYHTGNSTRRAILLHYGQTDVAADLSGWFHTYNGRQTIEAGIKEGKNVFQMHHLKVRSPQALLLQEHLATFAANFVRFAAYWLASREQNTTLPTKSVKQMVQVGAHTSAWVSRQGDVWLLRFTEQSFYAGLTLRFGGNGFFQLPLPLFIDFHFSHF
jgi:hypothetical protein